MTARPQAATTGVGSVGPVIVVLGSIGVEALLAMPYRLLAGRCSLLPLQERDALALQRRDDVPVVIVDGSVVDAVGVARHLARVETAAEIVLLAADGRRATIEGQLRHSPIPGGRVTVYDVARPDLAAELLALLDRAQRRARFRSTIDVVNHRLAAPSTTVSRPTVVADHLLAGILTGAREPIIAVDSTGAVVVWNAAAERVLELPAAEAYGRTVREVLARVEPLDALLRLIEGGAGGTVTCTIDAGRRTLNVTVNPLREAGGGAALMLYDITDRVRDELTLRRTSDELSRSNKDLEQFAYIAAHDLQEPLRGITMFADLLKRRSSTQPDDIAARHLTKIISSADRMRELIQAVLAFSTIGRKAIARADVQVADLVAAAMESLTATVAHRSAVISCTTSYRVQGDRALLTQVMQNLIANAIKFQPPERRPEVRIDSVLDGPLVRVSVADNGIGIQPEHLAKLFRVFQRLRAREEYPGTGIGLATCRRIVELHGGRIWVDSAFGQGSTFTFTLPAGEPGNPT